MDKTTVWIMGVCCTAIAAITIAGIMNLRDRPDDYDATQHPPTYVEVQCDAFDVHVYPHDEASKQDAEEWAEEFSVADGWCHAANVRQQEPTGFVVETPTDHPEPVG